MITIKLRINYKNYFKEINYIRNLNLKTNMKSEEVSNPIAESQFDEFENDRYNESADNWKRFFNHIIDIIGYYVFVILFAILAAGILSVISPETLNSIDPNSKLFEYLLGFILGVVYYTLIEFSTGGRSIGKYITKTKIITLDGEKPVFKQYLIRSLCRFIPLEAFSFFGTTDAGWHDSISKTRVVKI